GSYTWSRTLDESSGIGPFLKTNDPTNPKASYGPADFDRTHVTSVGYIYEFPKIVGANNVLGKVVNDWSVSGHTVLESGVAYSVIDFSGAVASIFGDLSIVDPILPLAPGSTVRDAILQGTHGVNPAQPVLNVNAFAAPILVPSASNGI